MGGFNKGEKIRCIEAPERGIPLVEGRVYTVKAYFKDPKEGFSGGEEFLEELSHLSAVTVAEAPGYFRANRFLALDAS